MSNSVEWMGCDCSVTRGKFDINNIPLDCKATWKLIASGCTVGVFQLEQKLGQDWARRVKPESITELADLLSLLRPGCLESGMTQDYVDIKFLKKSPTYLHPALKPILSPTYSCLVYQEQAIRIAVEIAGFSLAQADNLRKGIGKKLPEVIAKLKEEFVNGAVKKGLVTKPQAEEMFGWIEKFQRYGFNKSHAVSYAIVAYQTAYLKTHFPPEFYCSYLTFSQYKGDEKDEVYRLAQDARLFGIEVQAPDVRKCNPHFKIVDGAVRFGLAHIRGVGQAAIEKITALVEGVPETAPEALSASGLAAPVVAETQAGAQTGVSATKSERLATWPDYLRAGADLHRNVAEALVKAGACDCYQMPRTQMLAELEAVLGSTGRDPLTGEKTEVRGLTPRELEYFSSRFAQYGNTATTLEAMSLVAESEGPRPLSKLSKPEIVDAIIALAPAEDRAAIMKISRKDLSDRLKAMGYVPAKKAVANDKRREIISAKAKLLQREFVDTNTANAHAEKHFLGISLSCSPADDADSSMATGTCVDVARSMNDQGMSVVAIIDMVKHTRTKRGKKPGSPMCFVTLSDSTYSLDHCVVFPDAYEKLGPLCMENNIVLAYGKKREGSFLISDMKKLL